MMINAHARAPQEVHGVQMHCYHHNRHVRNKQALALTTHCILFDHITRAAQRIIRINSNGRTESNGADAFGNCRS